MTALQLVSCVTRQKQTFLTVSNAKYDEQYLNSAAV